MSSENSNELRLEVILVDPITEAGAIYASSTAWKWDFPSLKQYFRDLQTYLRQSTMYSQDQKIEAE